MPKDNVDKLPLINSMVALDPGERCFQTFYSPTLNGSIGYHTRNRYQSIFLESDKLKSKIAKLKNKLKKIKNKCKKKSLKNIIKKLHKKFLSVITKPTRITKEMHNKTALFLCKNFKVIAIPEYSSKQTSKDLPKIINKCNQALSHFKFRQRLIHKAKQWGRIVHFVPEAYTSVTCTKCGFQNLPTKDENLICFECKAEMGRDIRGSRNIFIKTIDIFKKNC
jgi:putative transposase